MTKGAPGVDGEPRVCIAGKNDIAANCLLRLLADGMAPSELCVVGNRNDPGRHTWQRSLLASARSAGVRIWPIEEVQRLPDIRFFSLEHDRILRPARFRSPHLYNLHFSKLPAYRGVATSVWPLVREESESGVTLHRIDDGIDTGPIVARRSFPIVDGMTASDLYEAYTREGEALFASSYRQLLAGEPTLSPQNLAAGSYYPRAAIDYAHPPIDFTAPASAVLACLRGFTFWQYQLPEVAGRRVWSACLTDTDTSLLPGELRIIDEWTAALGTGEGTLRLTFCFLDNLLSWARGGDAPRPFPVSLPNLEVEDANGWTPLMVAAHHGSLEVAEWLLRAGARLDHQNRRGTSALMYAQTRAQLTGDLAMARMLITAGADKSLTGPAWSHCYRLLRSTQTSRTLAITTPMNVPFLDLKAINARHAAELKAAAARVIDSGWYVLGEEVKAFESEFAAWVGSPHCVGTSDGLSALILALRGWKELGLLKDGDGVAVPANTYIASILAITENRLRPVLVEPDEDTCNLGAGKLAAALTPDVKAVLAVHLYGQLADMPAIANLCRERNLLLLEDAAQSHGAQIDVASRPAPGAMPRRSVSIPGKNLGALGDAGALTCKDKKLADMVRALRNYGSHEKYKNLVQGPNDRLDELQAALLRVKLKYIDADNARRQRDFAARYRREIKNPAVRLPAVRAGEDSHVWHLFVVRVAGSRGLPAAPARPRRAHRHPLPNRPAPSAGLRAVARPSEAAALTEALHREVVSLPVSPVMTDEQVAHCHRGGECLARG